MKYTVTWTRSADNELVKLWLEAADRLAVRKAAYQIEKDLARRPDQIGESREGARRVHFVAPLGVMYDIDEADRRVRVALVWTFRKRDS